MITYYALWVKIPLVLSLVVAFSFTPSILLRRFPDLSRIVCTVVAFLTAGLGWTTFSVEERFAVWDGYISTIAVAVIMTTLSLILLRVLKGSKHRVLNTIIVILFGLSLFVFFNIFATREQIIFNPPGQTIERIDQVTFN